MDLKIWDNNWDSNGYFTLFYGITGVSKQWLAGESNMTGLLVVQIDR